MRKEHIVSEVKKNTKVQKINDYFEDFGEGYCARYQECLWNLFENPNSSLPAKVKHIQEETLIKIFTDHLLGVSDLGVVVHPGHVPQHHAGVQGQGSSEQQNHRGSNICFDRGHLHLMVHYRIPSEAGWFSRQVEVHQEASEYCGRVGHPSLLPQPQSDG